MPAKQIQQTPGQPRAVAVNDVVKHFEQGRSLLVG
jgi:hypothetical protein